MTAAGESPSGGIVRIAAAGDTALRIEFRPRIDPAINARAIGLAALLRRRLGQALRDVVAGFHTVTVHFDPLSVDPGWLESEITACAAEPLVGPEAAGGMLEVPVCYGGGFGPDLADVARFGGCSEEEVVGLHAGRRYRVYMVGFVPGFAYMAEVDARIAAPRRATPRTAVPVGSVAIAGAQTGIYPATTPGGWNIIGRTPLCPYDPARAEPFLFRAGDGVRFRAITRREFDRA